jgi:uncharacterized membrane protein YcgQ (UPF0703/DUF1980 family)
MQKIVGSNPISRCRSVRLLGFVSKEPKARGGRFELARVYITCCVADSVPMGVTIEPADPHAPAYGRDDWLAASGQLARRGRKLVLRATPSSAQRRQGTRTSASRPSRQQAGSRRQSHWSFLG